MPEQARLGRAHRHNMRVHTHFIFKGKNLNCVYRCWNSLSQQATWIHIKTKILAAQILEVGYTLPMCKISMIIEMEN
jgi:hypothetical protein